MRRSNRRPRLISSFGASHTLERPTYIRGHAFNAPYASSPGWRTVPAVLPTELNSSACVRTRACADFRVLFYILEWDR